MTSYSYKQLQQDCKFQKFQCVTLDKPHCQVPGCKDVTGGAIRRQWYHTGAIEGLVQPLKTALGCEIGKGENMT